MVDIQNWAAFVIETAMLARPVVAPAGACCLRCPVRSSIPNASSSPVWIIWPAERISFVGARQGAEARLGIAFFDNKFGATPFASLMKASSFARVCRTLNRTIAYIRWICRTVQLIALKAMTLRSFLRLIGACSTAILLVRPRWGHAEVFSADLANKPHSLIFVTIWRAIYGLITAGIPRSFKSFTACTTSKRGHSNLLDRFDLFKRGIRRSRRRTCRWMISPPKPHGIIP